MTNVFFEIHSGLPREGPGDEASTLRALSLVRELPKEPAVLDIGCGPGAQTLILARATGGHVTAVDTHPPFLDDLRRRAAAAGLSGLVRAVDASMLELPFRDGSFDLIWSEGAIYQMGFDRGLRSWRRLLRPRGWVAVTEISWILEDPPQELFDFWRASYPGIRRVEDNLAALREEGYEAAGYFVLPDSAWWDPYYTPILAKLPGLRQKHGDDAEALAVLDQEEIEIDLFRKYSAYYGYVFYVMRRGG
jgi:ubiquinone/menaquinone biosynthesis C-methylase UbiE